MILSLKITKILDKRVLLSMKELILKIANP